VPLPNRRHDHAGAELRLINGLSLLGKFDGEFASHSSTYAGTGTVRYTWKTRPIGTPPQTAAPRDFSPVSVRFGSKADFAPCLDSAKVSSPKRRGAAGGASASL